MQNAVGFLFKILHLFACYSLESDGLDGGCAGVGGGVAVRAVHAAPLLARPTTLCTDTRTGDLLA